MTTSKNLWLVAVFIIILVVVGYMVSQKNEISLVETETEKEIDMIAESNKNEENVSDIKEVDGRHIGYVKNFSFEGQGSLTIDYIQFLDCSECPNGFEIKNENTELRTFSVSPNAQVKMQTYSHSESGDFNQNQIISQAEFQVAIKEKGWGTRPYWITVQKGVVVEISEQYIP